jgi:hypothetical protein
MFAIFMIVLVAALYLTDRWLGTRSGIKKANIPRGTAKKFVASRKR